MTTPISESQNADQNVRLIGAWLRRFRIAQRWRRARLAGTMMLSLAAPAVVLIDAGARPLLGAIAGAWVLLARTALTFLEQRSRRKGAAIQEVFDTRIFSLPWNAALVGRAPAAEDINDDAADSIDPQLRNWYPPAAGSLIWPMDVLLCQRSSVVWGRRDHTAYAAVVLGSTIMLFIVGLAVGAVADLSLATYLVALFLPTLPAYLDAVDQLQAHLGQAQRKGLVEAEIDELLEDARASSKRPESTRCRELQDRIYLNRQSGPQVPPRFYRWRRDRNESAMQQAASELAASLPAALHRGR